MKRSKLTESQIVAMLNEGQAGVKVMVLLKAATTNSGPNIKAWAFQIYSG
ncbi:hypothetical protein PsalN5692_03390 [Piscirickettsia salmonis]|nr:hypothetical protein [Piscirickettsia salmonis]QGP51891.1 hypothetical protein PsalN5692_03390 [Piscirickettsia salmonis]